MSFVHNINREVYVLEARHPDGSLNFAAGAEAPSAPKGADSWTLDQLFDLWFAAHGDEEVGPDINKLETWLISKGWKARVKTW